MAEDHEVGTTQWYINLGCGLACVCGAALAAGLTMGMMSLDPMKMQLAQKQGTKSQRRWAGKVLPLIKRHHILLVTLLLMNSLANEALPLFLDKLVSPALAIILSVTCVLIFGEIIPSALFTGPRRLQLSAALAPAVWVFIFVSSPITIPLAWLLDRLLGTSHGDHLSRRELRALVGLHAASVIRKHNDGDGDDDDDDDEREARPRLPEGLRDDEVKIIQGALDLKDKIAKDCMFPFDQMYMLSMTDVLDNNTMADILSSGHSRVPIYDGRRDNVRGLLLVKRLIVLDPEDCRPVGSLPLRRLIFVAPDTPMLDMLDMFQTGRSHMAMVVAKPKAARRAIRRDEPMPADVRMLGFICLEDILEALIQEDIEDELDLAVSVLRTIRSETPRPSYANGGLGRAPSMGGSDAGDASVERAVSAPPLDATGDLLGSAAVEARAATLAADVHRRVAVERAVSKFKQLARRAHQRRTGIARRVSEKHAAPAGADEVSPAQPLLSGDEEAPREYGAVHGPQDGAGAGAGAGSGGDYTRLE